MSSHQPKERMDQLTQLMIIMMEECGELIQACSKVLRSRSRLGLIPDKTLLELNKEMADVLCMKDLMYEYELLDTELIRKGIESKREKLKTWSTLID